jgi:cyclopropane-fatty-acyl-phospholipid synthase
MGAKGAELTSDIEFIKTPAAKPAEFATGEDCGIPLTNVSSLLLAIDLQVL